MQDRRQNTLSQRRQIVGVTVSDLAQEPMQAQSFEQPTDATASPVFEYTVQAPSGQTAQCILPAQHRLQGLSILLQKRIESPKTASPLVVLWTPKLGDFSPASAMLHHPRQPLAIPIKSRLHQFDQIAQAVNAFLHRRQCVLLSPVLMYYLSVVPEKRHIIGRHLQPEDASGFVCKVSQRP